MFDNLSQLRKINNLNDIELEALRVELAHRFPVFLEVQQEVAFLATIEQAVQQFYQGQKDTAL